MEGFSVDAVINEDEIVFDFGDESFEPRDFEFQNSFPALTDKPSSGFDPWNELESRQTLDTGSHLSGLENHQILSMEAELSVPKATTGILDSKPVHSLLESPKHSLENHHPDVETQKPDLGVHHDLFVKIHNNSDEEQHNLDTKMSEAPVTSLHILSHGDGDPYPVLHCLGHDDLVYGVQRTVEDHNLPILSLSQPPTSDLDNPLGFSELTIHNVSSASSSQVNDSLNPSSWILSASHRGEHQDQPVSSFQHISKLSSGEGNSNVLLPGTHLSMCNPLPSIHHPIKGSFSSQVPDDEFDFDDLIASRTVSKPSPPQGTNDESDLKLAPFLELHTQGEKCEEVLEQACDEWDTVQTIEPDFEVGGALPKAYFVIEPITFREAIAALDANRLLQQYGGSIKTSVTRGRLAAFFHQLCGGPRIQQRLCAERDLAFCLAACPFDNEDPTHFRVLFSIYKQLTGSKLTCPRFGSHWEVIGFQGHDPATDLRGAGLLALLQLLNLVTEQKTAALMRNIYRLSLHETQNFPFCVMGINLTRITMTAMREDFLNKECNSKGQVLNVMNDFYVGLFHRLHVIWRTQHKTIRDTGFVLADLEVYAKKHPQEMVKTKLETELVNTSGQDFNTTRDIANIDTDLF